jgi:hypothetical protein
LCQRRTALLRDLGDLIALSAADAARIAFDLESPIRLA